MMGSFLKVARLTSFAVVFTRKCVGFEYSKSTVSGARNALDQPLGVGFGDSTIRVILVLWAWFFVLDPLLIASFQPKEGTTAQRFKHKELSAKNKEQNRTPYFRRKLQFVHVRYQSSFTSA
jgi:hypothetical protein